MEEKNPVNPIPQTNLYSWLRRMFTCPRRTLVTLEEARAAFPLRSITEEDWVKAREALGNIAQVKMATLSQAKGKGVFPPIQKVVSKDILLECCKELKQRPWATLQELKDKGIHASKDTYHRAQVCTGGVNPFQKALYKDCLDVAVSLVRRGKSLEQLTSEEVSRLFPRRKEGLGYVHVLKKNPYFKQAVDSACVKKGITSSTVTSPKEVAAIKAGTRASFSMGAGGKIGADLSSQKTRAPSVPVTKMPRVVPKCAAHQTYTVVRAFTLEEGEEVALIPGHQGTITVQIRKIFQKGEDKVG